LCASGGLAIDHVPFHKNYAFLCTSCFVPGWELAFFLVALLALDASLQGFAVFFAVLMPLGLLLAPTLLNPMCFSTSLPALEPATAVSYVAVDTSAS
jgi:hypothetical protein